MSADQQCTGRHGSQQECGIVGELRSLLQLAFTAIRTQHDTPADWAARTAVALGLREANDPPYQIDRNRSSKAVTVLTAAKITELTTKFPNLGIDTFVHERDYNQAENARRALEQDIAQLRLARETTADCHGLDNARQVFFYEQDYYVLSNFSAFTIYWSGRRFDTSEQLYHWLKFSNDPGVQQLIHDAESAHVAFKLAEQYRARRRPDWDEKKVRIMRDVLRAKALQHEYVRRKLLATGDRELIENSWRDDFWGWGPNHDGQNMLGKLWMEIRAELRSSVKSVCEPALTISKAPQS